VREYGRPRTQSEGVVKSRKKSSNIRGRFCSKLQEKAAPAPVVVSNVTINSRT
jgi:hypothetical protein